MWAKLTPMRFEDGALTAVRRGRTWTVQRLYGADGREYLYIFSLYLPRFLDQSFDEKLTTVLHELWHIGPRFDGDLRRHDGRCFAHGSSQRKYDDAMRELARKWTAADPPPSVYDFLHGSFADVRRRYGIVHGTTIPMPKLIPIRTPRDITA
jgi:hypothetical protein